MINLAIYPRDSMKQNKPKQYMAFATYYAII
jgi:hypothetical protein